MLNDDEKKKIGQLIEIRRNELAQFNSDFQIKNFLKIDSIPICDYKTYVRIRNGYIVNDDEVYDKLLAKLGYESSSMRQLCKAEVGYSSSIIQSIASDDYDKLEETIKDAICYLKKYNKSIYATYLAEIYRMVEDYYLSNTVCDFCQEKLVSIVSCFFIDTQELLLSLLLYNTLFIENSLPKSKEIIMRLKVKKSRFIVLLLYYATYLYYNQFYHDVISYLDNIDYNTIQGKYKLDCVYLVLMSKCKLNIEFENELENILNTIPNFDFEKDSYYASLFHIMFINNKYDYCDEIFELTNEKSLGDEEYQLLMIEKIFIDSKHNKNNNQGYRLRECKESSNPISVLYACYYQESIGISYIDIEKKLFLHLKKWKKEIEAAEIGFVFIETYRKYVSKTRQYKHYFDLF